MAGIINLSDRKNPKLFQPKDKYGLLVIGKDFINGFAVNTPGFLRWSPHISGNMHIYDWELLMTGTIDCGKKSLLNKISNNDEENKSIENVLRSNFKRELELYESGNNRNGKYKEAIKIWPGTTEVLCEFQTAIDRISCLSNQDTLTTMIIFSHGHNNSVDFGSSYLSYKKLLEDLDRIEGKKAIFAYACYSGSLIDTLKLHKKTRDYSIITSSESNKRSSNWDDQSLDNYLFEHFSLGGKYSNLKLEQLRNASDNQSPQMLSYFDVQLI